MGIFTGNRTALGSDVEVVANEAYANEFGAAMLVAESYTNDATVFEQVITCDFLEAAVLAEAETGDVEDTTTEEKTEKVEGAKKNVLVKLWDAIIKLIGELKKKIVGVIEGAQTKFQQWRQKNVDELVKKKQDAFMKADLSNVKKPTILWTTDFSSLDLSNIDVALNDYCDFSKYIGKTAKEVAEMSQKRKEAESLVYGKLVGKEKVTAKEFKAMVHENLFNKEKTEMPFADSNIKEQIITTITTNLDAKNVLTELKKSLLADLKKKETKAKQMSKDAKKADKGEARTNATAVAKACQELVSVVQRVAGNAMGTLISEQQKLFSVALSLFKFGATYKAKGESFLDEEFVSLDSEDIFDEAMIDSELDFDGIIECSLDTDVE